MVLIMKKLLILLLLPITLLAQRQQVLYTLTFDDGVLTSPIVSQKCCSIISQHFTVPDSTALSTAMAYMFELDTNAATVAGGKRSELALNAGFTMPRVVWFGFAIYQPSIGMGRDTTKDIIIQWHGHLSNAGQPPPISVRDTSNEVWLRVQWSTDDGTTIMGTTDMRIDSVKHDQWIYWVFRIVFNYQPTGDGLIEIWENGQYIKRWSGANCYNEGSYPYLKFGIYKPGWNAGIYPADGSARKIYFDQVRVADSNGNYYSVAPIPVSDGIKPVSLYLIKSNIPIFFIFTDIYGILPNRKKKYFKYNKSK